MSHPENTLWQEEINDGFTEALEAKNWEMCHNIMADVRDNGFENLWNDMLKRYNLKRFVE